MMDVQRYIAAASLAPLAFVYVVGCIFVSECMSKEGGGKKGYVKTKRWTGRHLASVDLLGSGQQPL
jgi:hypothetical protein